MPPVLSWFAAWVACKGKGAVNAATNHVNTINSPVSQSPDIIHNQQSCLSYRGQTSISNPSSAIFLQQSFFSNLSSAITQQQSSISIRRQSSISNHPSAIPRAFAGKTQIFGKSQYTKIEKTCPCSLRGDQKPKGKMKWVNGSLKLLMADCGLYLVKGRAGIIEFACTLWIAFLYQATLQRKAWSKALVQQRTLRSKTIPKFQDHSMQSSINN